MAFLNATTEDYEAGSAWADLTNFRSILGFMSQFRIPRNQRMYAWSNSQVSILLKDLEDNRKIRNNGSNEKFSLGTIDLKETDDTITREIQHVPNETPIYDVFDGQQRLTTCFLMSVAAAEVYSEKIGNTDVVTRRRREIMRGGIPILKFDYDRLDTAFRLLVERGTLQGYELEHTDGKKPSGVYRMKKSYDTMKEYFQTKTPGVIEEIHNHMLEHTEIVLLNSLANGFVMFETRNNRGVKPNQLDLVKNFIGYVDNFHTLGLDFGRTKWREAMDKRDSSKLNNMSENIYADQVNRGENALLGRAQTVATGKYLGQGSYDEFYKEFNKLLSIDHTHAEYPDLVNSLIEFIQAFEDMSEAMAKVLGPQKGWVTYGSLDKWNADADFRAQRGHSLALLADIFVRLDIEAAWQVVILALYHKLDSIVNFNKCLRQIEKAAFRIYRLRSNSRNDFARNELSKLASKIYHWDSADQSGVLCYTLNTIAWLCINKAGSSLTEIYTELTTMGKNHYQTKWGLYLLYHYEVSLYPSLMLGSVTKSWNYSGKAPTGTGTVVGDNPIKFEKEHIMPQSLFPTYAKIRRGDSPNWLIDGDNSHETDGTSYWIRGSEPNDSVLFYWNEDGDYSEKKSYVDDFNGYKHWIGNLVMTKSECNQQYSNHPYIRQEDDNENLGKRRQYLCQNDFRRVKNISRIYTNWNKRTIKDRSEQIARWAIRRFRLDFCDDPGNDRSLDDLFQGEDWWTEGDIGTSEEEVHELPPVEFIPEHTDGFIQRCNQQSQNSEFDLGHPMVEVEEEDGALEHGVAFEIPQPIIEGHDGITLPDNLNTIYDFAIDYYIEPTDEEE